MEHYEAGARLGDSHAFNEIGVVHLAGEGVPVDRVEATAWFLVSMMMGDPSAAENLAEMFDELDARSVRRASNRAAAIVDEYKLDQLGADGEEG
jgi:TPR repeat protein